MLYRRHPVRIEATRGVQQRQRGTDTDGSGDTDQGVAPAKAGSGTWLRCARGADHAADERATQADQDQRIELVAADHADDDRDGGAERADRRGDQRPSAAERAIDQPQLEGRRDTGQNRQQESSG